jgi:hypothetical protein
MTKWAVPRGDSGVSAVELVFGAKLIVLCQLPEAPAADEARLEEELEADLSSINALP